MCVLKIQYLQTTKALLTLHTSKNKHTHAQFQQTCLKICWKNFCWFSKKNPSCGRGLFSNNTCGTSTTGSWLLNINILLLPLCLWMQQQCGCQAYKAKRKKDHWRKPAIHWNTTVPIAKSRHLQNEQIMFYYNSMRGVNYWGSQPDKKKQLHTVARHQNNLHCQLMIKELSWKYVENNR